MPGDAAHSKLVNQELKLIVRNEFAVMHVGVREVWNDRLLVIREPSSGVEISLDALEVESLTRLRHYTLRELLVEER